MTRLDDAGIEYVKSMTSAELEALLPTDQAVDLRLKELTPVNDTGWSIPTITTGVALAFDTSMFTSDGVPPVGGKTNRAFVPIVMGVHRFVQWSDTLQGNLLREQERLEANGIKVFEKDNGFIVINSKLSWTCSPKTGLRVEA